MKSMNYNKELVEIGTTIKSSMKLIDYNKEFNEIDKLQ